MVLPHIDMKKSGEVEETLVMQTLVPSGFERYYFRKLESFS